jgi:hypothetical protein
LEDIHTVTLRLSYLFGSYVAPSSSGTAVSPAIQQASRRSVGIMATRGDWQHFG